MFLFCFVFFLLYVGLLEVVLIMNARTSSLAALLKIESCFTQYFISTTWRNQFSSVQLLSCIPLIAIPWTRARQATKSAANSRSFLKFMSIETMIPSNHLILCHPFLLLPSIFPSIKLFSNESVLHISGQSTGVSASASVIPMNIQNWSPLTGWVFLHSKGLSRVFSNTTVQKHQFFSAQLSSQSNSHIHTWLLEKP